MSTSETDLWPSDITSQEYLEPKEILQHQAELLSERMNGKVRGEIEEMVIELDQEPEQSRIVLNFYVVAANDSLKVKILEVTHRKEHPYPAAITSHEKLPDYLRKRYYKLGISEEFVLGSTAMSAARDMNGEWIENDGVCSTPKEFLKKLKITLGTPEVKSAVMSVLAAASK